MEHELRRFPPEDHPTFNGWPPQNHKVHFLKTRPHGLRLQIILKNVSGCWEATYQGLRKGGTEELIQPAPCPWRTFSRRVNEFRPIAVLSFSVFPDPPLQICDKRPILTSQRSPRSEWAAARLALKTHHHCSGKPRRFNQPSQPPVRRPRCRRRCAISPARPAYADAGT